MFFFNAQHTLKNKMIVKNKVENIQKSEALKSEGMANEQ